MSQPGDGSGPQSTPLQLPSPLSLQGGIKYFSLLLHVLMADSLATFVRLQLADCFKDDEQQLTTAQLAAKTGCHCRLRRLLELAGPGCGAEGGLSPLRSCRGRGQRRLMAPDSRRRSASLV